jgi:hypothetical protein
MSKNRQILIFVIFLFPVLIFGKTDYYKIGNYPIIVLKGSPYEMGLSYGNYFNKELKQNIGNLFKIEKLYLKRGFFLTKPFIRAKFNGRLKKIRKKIPDEYVKVLKGISLASEINIKDIIFFNSFIDFIKPEFSKSYFIANDRGKNIIGGNIYMCDDKIVSILKPIILLFLPDNGNKYFGFTLSGLTSVYAGLNENGIAVFSFKPKTGYSQISEFIVNTILQFSSSINETTDLIKKYGENIDNINIAVISFNENKRYLYMIKDKKIKRERIQKGSVVFPKLFYKTGEETETIDRKSFKIGLRMQQLMLKGVYPQYILSDQIDIFNGKKLIIDDSINNQDTIQSFILEKNRIVFSAGVGYASHRQKIVFSSLDFFTGDIGGKIYKTEKLSQREKKLILFKMNLEKIGSIKNRIKFLDNLYSDQKYYEYYIIKTKLLYKSGKYKKVLKLLDETVLEHKLNDTLLFYKYKTFLKLKKKEEAKQVMELIKTNKILKKWIRLRLENKNKR